MPDTYSLTVAGEVEIARVTQLSEAIELAEHEIANAADALVQRLVDAGCFRIHRNWSASKERTLATQLAAKAAVQAILTNDWCDLPLEVAHLHVERAQ